MLVIRPEQMALLEEAVQRAFVERVVAHLQQHHPESVKGISDADLRERVTCGIACGREHGLTWASTLTAFVTLQFVVSPRFYHQPNIQAALTAEGVAERDRFDQLFASTNEQDWQEAKQFGNADAWGQLR
jgi:hypothetical protein